MPRAIACSWGWCVYSCLRAPCKDLELRPRRQAKGQKGPVDVLLQALGRRTAEQERDSLGHTQHGLYCPMPHMAVSICTAQHLGNIFILWDRILRLSFRRGLQQITVSIIRGRSHSWLRQERGRRDGLDEGKGQSLPRSGLTGWARPSKALVSAAGHTHKR